MEFHPIADSYPLLEGQEFDALCASIRLYGLLEDIITYEDKILDGRNRHRACTELNITPRFRTWAGECGSPRAFVDSMNDKRRHMTATQRLLAYKKLTSMPSATAAVEATPEPSVNSVAKAEGLSESTVKRANKIARGSPLLGEAVSKGKLSVRAATRASDLPAAVQDRIAATALSEGQQAGLAAVEEAEDQMPADPPSGGIDGVLKDGAGLPVPDELVKVFRCQPRFQELVNLLDKAMHLYEELSLGPCASEMLSKDFRADLFQLKQIRSNVASAKPYTTCSYCAGTKEARNGGPCTGCKGAGWLSRLNT